MPCEKSVYQQTGALVSAGFKVSATVGGSHAAIDSINKESSKSRMYSSQNEVGKSTADKYYAVHKISTMSEQPIKLMHDEKSQLSVVRKSYR